LGAVAQPQIEVRRADGRFEVRTDWSESHYSISFGPHYDPANTGFGRLAVNNHELVRPGTGFDSHPHAESEIVTWVLSGGLVHQDSNGHSGVVYPGLAQRMSAGRGILHSERNDAYRAGEGWRIDPDRVVEPVEFVQMWVLPDEPGLPPSYDQHELDRRQLHSDWVPIASGSHPSAAIKINSAGSTLWATVLEPGVSRVLPASRLRSHLYVARGEVDCESLGVLAVGDAVRIVEAEPLRLRAVTEAEILVWELP
jgi:redox-sensitive bicupin YhaK (pirin superfamily)